MTETQTKDAPEQDRAAADDHAIAGLLRIQTQLGDLAEAMGEFEPADIEQRSLEGRGVWRGPYRAINAAAEEVFGLVMQLSDGRVTTAPTPPGDDPVEPMATEKTPAKAKPYICGTMDRDELRQAAADWLYYWIESNGCDDSIALKHHAERVAREGPQAGYVTTFQAVMLSSLLEASLDGMIDLLAPLIEKYVIPHVDWQKAADEAAERYDAYNREIHARVLADRQSAKADTTSTD